MTWQQRAEVYSILRERPETRDVHHGGCIGADSEFDQIAMNFGLMRWVHPGPDPDMQSWSPGAVELPRAPYLERNRVIVGLARLMIAAPKETEEMFHGGTWYTAHHAIEMKVPLILIWPNGARLSI